MNDKLDREKCLQLLKDYETPAHVINHCKAVSEVAYRLSSRLNEVGHNLDVELCTYAGLLHDLARVEQNHGEVAAEYLSGLGYNDVAEIIKIHMYHNQFNPVKTITEADVVCIGDRVVIEGHYAGVRKRLEYIKNKKGSVSKIVQLKLKKLEEQLYAYIDKLEEEIGMKLDDLMKGIHEEDR